SAGDEGVDTGGGSTSGFTEVGNGAGVVGGGAIGAGTSTVFGASTLFGLTSAGFGKTGSGLASGFTAADSFLKPVATTCSVGDVDGAGASGLIVTGTAADGVCRAICGLRSWNSRTAALPQRSVPFTSTGRFQASAGMRKYPGRPGTGSTVCSA